MPGMTVEDKVTKHREEFVDHRGRVEERLKGIEGNIGAQGRNLDAKIKAQGDSLGERLDTLQEGQNGIAKDVRELSSTVTKHLNRRNGNGQNGRFHAIMHSPAAKNTALGSGGAGIGAVLYFVAQKLLQ